MRKVYLKGILISIKELLQYLTKEQQKDFEYLGIEGIVFKKEIKNPKRIKELLLKPIKIVKLAKKMNQTTKNLLNK